MRGVVVELPSCVAVDNLEAVGAVAAEADSPEYLASQAERRRLLQACLATLDERHFRLLGMRYAQDSTFAAIGAALAIGAPAAKQLHDRILLKLLAVLASRQIRSTRDI